MNRATLIGNLGQDPEIKPMSNGKEMALLPVATSERWKDKATGKDRQEVQWHRVAVFEPKLVEYAKKELRKGSFVRLEGKIVNQKYTGEDGVERYSSQIQLSGPQALLMSAGRERSNEAKQGR